MAAPPVFRPDFERMSSFSATQAHRDILAPAMARSVSARSRSDGQAVARRHGLAALNDTPETSVPNSPAITPMRSICGEQRVFRPRATTLDVPGLTKSRVSPDGKIAPRDVGAKLVIVMVGLPARGKSYITKKLARYLNWLQHDTKIFNVGERRRVVARQPSSSAVHRTLDTGIANHKSTMNGRYAAPMVTLHPASPSAVVDDPLVELADSLEAALTHSGPNGGVNGHANGNGTMHHMPLPTLELPDASQAVTSAPVDGDADGDADGMEQSANFFDPGNLEAAKIREQCAIDALDELLDWILVGGGSVGILDATNSTLERRRVIVEHTRQRAPDLQILFMESVCRDQALLERNMRLKLSGPDYKDKDPISSLMDFKNRVKMYEKSYVPLGDYEEMNNMAYVQMIDVGRKIISHQIKGFLSAQAVYYLTNFNLAPRQIWITRHGESLDNVTGHIGGDAPLTGRGKRYASALARFLAKQREEWEYHELEKEKQALSSPLPGDISPPNPHYTSGSELSDHILMKNFCIWTSMLSRSVETAQDFDDNDFDVKQMRMLNEINAGYYEGKTYADIKANHREEFVARRLDKLSYRYPGPGGESYLDVINRLRQVIVELERTTDHVCIIGHRSIVRILLAYFRGLSRDDVTDLDVPLGLLYCLEPKPYGVDFKAYCYNPEKEWFELEPDYQLKRSKSEQ